MAQALAWLPFKETWWNWEFEIKFAFEMGWAILGCHVVSGCKRLGSVNYNPNIPHL